MSILMSILSSDGYIILNKYVMKAIGLNEAVLLGELCSEFIYWYKENKLKDGYFFSTRENIEKETTLSSHQQRQAIKKLIEMGFVETINQDMPKKTYYKINEDRIYKFLTETDLEFSDVKKVNNKMLKYLTTSDEKIEGQEVKNFNTNNNILNNNNNSILSYPMKEEIEEKDKMDYEQLFKQNIEYQILIQDNRTKDLLQNITDIAIDTLNTTKKEIYINSEPKPVELVKSQFLKLNPCHIQYVISCLQQNAKEVKSIKSYILTTLYNAVNTMSIDTTLQVAKIMNN